MRTVLALNLKVLIVFRKSIRNGCQEMKVLANNSPSEHTQKEPAHEKLEQSNLRTKIFFHLFYAIRYISVSMNANSFGHATAYSI